MNRNKKLTVALVGLIMIFSVALFAEEPVTISLTPEADTDVRWAFPDYAKGDRADLWFKTAENDGMKSYLRFRLPSDFGAAVSVQLKLTRSVLGPWNFTYNLHGLNDEVAGQEWVEVHSLTWNNAPGNDTASTSDFTVDATDVLDSFTADGGNSDGVVGSEHVFADPNGNIVAFLNTDTDGVVNLMIARTGVSSSTEAFASKENGSYDVPTLELTYLPSDGVGVVTLNTVADTDIRQNSADYAKGDRTWHYLCNSSTASGKVYMRFELPEDIATITSANLVLTAGAVLSTSYDSAVNVHGLNDNVAGQDWVEVHSLTWNNAPGNDTASGFGFSSDATGILATFDIVGGRNGAAVGDQYTISSEELVGFLNADSDGIVNLMIGRVGVSSAYHGIAAKEMGTQPGPQLQITYEVAQPAVYLKGDLNQDMVIDFKDFASIASHWMESTDPAND